MTFQHVLVETAGTSAAASAAVAAGGIEAVATAEVLKVPPWRCRSEVQAAQRASPRRCEWNARTKILLWLTLHTWKEWQALGTGQEMEAGRAWSID
jgi:hypothetical protein